MPLTITKLKMWKDPGYTRGCIEVPPAGSKKLPTPDYVLPDSETLRPHKNSTLTSLNLPLSYTQTFDMSYLYIEASDGAGSVALFGWIDSVTQRSTSYEGVTISWSVDWWRSYSGSLTFGRGVITKTSDSTYKRPMGVNPRMWIYDSSDYRNSRSMRDSIGSHYVDYFFLFTFMDSSQNLRLGVTTALFKVGGTAYTGLGPGDIEEIPEMFGIPSTNIKGCWVSSYFPFTKQNVTYNNGYYEFPDYWGAPVTHTSGGTTRAYFQLEIANGSLQFYTADLSNAQIKFQTNDTEKAVLIDGYGTPYLTLPYGFECNYIAIKTDIGATEAYHSVILSEQPITSLSQFYNAKLKAIEEGRYVNIPLAPVAVASNSLSDYIVSGQRDYDIETRRMDQERAAWQGALGIGGSIAGGTVSGALAGGGAGAAAGAIAGTISGTVGTVANYWLSEYYNDKLQSATEKLYSNQASQLITIGSTADKISDAIRGFSLLRIQADSASADEINGQINTQGYSVEIPVSDTSSFISTGPIQIKNLQLGGAAPPAAKAAIKNKFENGVYIIENNPTGTSP